MRPSSKLSLSGQATAVEIARTKIVPTTKSINGRERDLLAEQLLTTQRTLELLVPHENEIRAILARSAE